MTTLPTRECIWKAPNEPLSLSEVKQYLRIEGSDDNAIVKDLILAVTHITEKYLNSSLLRQQWRLVYDKYIPSSILLPMGPIMEILSVRSFGRDGLPTKHSSDYYYLNGRKTRLLFDANIIASEIEIDYLAGYGHNPSDVPPAIKDGMLYHIASIYDGRAGVNVIPPKSEALYKPYKIIQR